MMMLGFWRLGRCKTKFRSCEGEVKKGRRQTRGEEGAEKEVGEMYNNTFCYLRNDDDKKNNKVDVEAGF